MKKLLIVAILFFSVNSFAQTQYIDLENESKVKADIKNDVLLDYADSNSSVKLFMINNNIKSYNTLMEMRYGLNSDEHNALIKIVNDYYPKFNVILFMLKREIKAIKELQEVIDAK